MWPMHVLPFPAPHLHRDDSLLANLLHGLSNEITNLSVTIGTDGANLCNLFCGADLLGTRLECLVGTTAG